MDDPFNPKDEDGRFGYAWDIGMALRKVTLFDHRKRRMTLDDKMLLGSVIIKHLRMSGVILDRKLPAHGHVGRT